MKAQKPTKLSNRQRRMSEAQVQEYVDRYQPQLGKVAVEISPCGRFASARAHPKPKGDD
jgi:hypothetical protein